MCSGIQQRRNDPGAKRGAKATGVTCGQRIGTVRGAQLATTAVVCNYSGLYVRQFTYEFCPTEQIKPHVSSTRSPATAGCCIVPNRTSHAHTCSSFVSERYDLEKLQDLLKMSYHHSHPSYYSLITADINFFKEPKLSQLNQVRCRAQVLCSHRPYLILHSLLCGLVTPLARAMVVGSWRSMVR